MAHRPNSAAPGSKGAAQKAVDSRNPYSEVFYVDEADIDLYPKPGFLWTPADTSVRTPGTL